MNFKKILMLSIAVFSCSASAKNVQYVEDVYMKQATPALVKFVDEVAAELGYSGNYELIEPKKAALQINPWNRLVCAGVNPGTKNNFMVINSEWLNKLSKDEKKFIVGHFVSKFDLGLVAPASTYLPFVYIALFWLLVGLLFFLFGKLELFADKKWWMRLAPAYLIMLVLNLAVGVKLQQKHLDYLAFRHLVNVNNKVLQKLPNKEAAVKALRYFDKSIVDGAANGEVIFEPSKGLFANAADEIECGHKKGCGCNNH